MYEVLTRKVTKISKSGKTKIVETTRDTQRDDEPCVVDWEENLYEKFEDIFGEMFGTPEAAEPEGYIPHMGDVVRYKLSGADADEINRRRTAASAHYREHQTNANGVQIHVGNIVAAGDIYPLVITRVWGDTPGCCVNGQVMLDGNDLYWATSRKEGDAPGEFSTFDDED